jgi:ATP-binding cassette subfamily B protein
MECLRKPIPLTVFGGIAAVVLVILWICGYGMPATIAALFMFLLMHRSTFGMLRLSDEFETRKKMVERRIADISNSIGVIRDYDGENYELERFNKDADDYETVARVFLFLRRLMTMLSGIIIGGTAGIVLIIAAYKTPAPTLSAVIFAFLGTIITLWSEKFCFKEVTLPDGILSATDKKNVNVSLAKRYGLRMEYGDVADAPGKGEIVFQAVEYSFPGTNTPVINGVSLVIKPGEHFGFVGRTDAGKTTLLRLLSREIDVTDGAILVDGVDLRDYTKAGLEKIFAWKNHHLDVTIDDNYGGDTHRNERSDSNDSSENEQNPKKILIIDGEPDINIKERSGTVVIASKCTVNVKSCDRIAVIDAGMIEAVGTHETLLQNNTLYRKLYSADHPDEALPPLIAEDGFSEILDKTEKSG